VLSSTASPGRTRLPSAFWCTAFWGEHKAYRDINFLQAYF